jgi:integrase
LPTLFQIHLTTYSRAFKAAGLGVFSAKSLRHFVASMMANAGYNLELIGRGLGHSENSKCTKVYVHPYDSTLKEAFGTLDK